MPEWDRPDEKIESEKCAAPEDILLMADAHKRPELLQRALVPGALSHRPAQLQLRINPRDLSHEEALSMLKSLNEPDERKNRLR